jgi:hypothetical protein
MAWLENLKYPQFLLISTYREELAERSGIRLLMYNFIRPIAQEQGAEMVV